MGVKDPRHEPKFLYGCKRPAVLSATFCLCVRDLRHEPNFMLPKENTRSCLSLRPRVELQESGLT